MVWKTLKKIRKTILKVIVKPLSGHLTMSHWHFSKVFHRPNLAHTSFVFTARICRGGHTNYEGQRHSNSCANDSLERWKPPSTPKISIRELQRWWKTQGRGKGGQTGISANRVLAFVTCAIFTIWVIFVVFTEFLADFLNQASLAQNSVSSLFWNSTLETVFRWFPTNLSMPSIWWSVEFIFARRLCMERFKRFRFRFGRFLWREVSCVFLFSLNRELRFQFCFL